MKNSGMLVEKFELTPLRETNLGVAQALAPSLKIPLKTEKARLPTVVQERSPC